MAYEVKIIVNGKEHTINTINTDNPHPVIDYDGVKQLAGYHIIDIPTCTFRNGDYSGTLSGFDKVEIVDGMVFNVADTSNA